MTLSKWGGLASFGLAATYLIPALVYLCGDLRSLTGPWAYRAADFLYGPAWAVCLVTAFWALQAQVGSAAPQRLTWARATTLAAAAAMVLVASIRSANRQYHLDHPSLHLEDNTTVLVIWGTLVAGVIGAGFHFLGWSFVLLGLVGWATRRLPLALCALLMTTGALAWFVYVLPDLEGAVVALNVILSIWQGMYLWGAKPFQQHPQAQGAT